MKRRSIALIVSLMSVALIGVMAMQYFFIRQSYIQKSQLFDESVKAAMSTVAVKAEKKEVTEYASIQQERHKAYEIEQRKLEEQLRLKTAIEKKRNEQSAFIRHLSELEYNLNSRYPALVHIENDFYETYVRVQKNQDLVTVELKPIHFQNGMVQQNIEVYATRKADRIYRAKDDSVRFLAFASLNPYHFDFNVEVLPPRKDLKMEREIKELEKELLLLQANTLMDTISILGGKNPNLLQDYTIAAELSSKPLSERIDIDYIHSLLKAELANRGVTAPFNMEIKEDGDVLYQFAAFGEDKDEKQTSLNTYSTKLFPEDLEVSSGSLSLFFPNKGAILMGNMATMLFSSGALLLILIGCFAYTLFTILRQKKVSEMKTDFINNMTHEFKTPVATIMIASESLRDPEIANNEQRVSRLANIIYDENVRLGSHIERVLNIARIEKNNLKLEKQDVIIDELAQIVVDSMELQLQKQGAVLNMQLDAEGAIVEGDELHLSNVLYNLLDNAIKYSKETPEISISTRKNNKHVFVTVEDKGIGMSRDQLSKIFEQFYRIPTGNRHDVKGFGLGLSYVNDIIKRMGGKIQVKSEKDKGTTFEVSLPLKR